ncbi:MAG: hypothetical protein R3A52_25640 [Polyangiales bacterium]
MGLGEALTTYFDGEKSAGLVLAGVGALACGWAFADPQVAALHATMERAPSEMLSAETPRMRAVQRNFPIIEVVELVMLAVGVAMALGLKGRPYLSEVGMGLALQASVMLVFDLLAEKRGALYLAALLRAAER